MKTAIEEIKCAAMVFTFLVACCVAFPLMLIGGAMLDFGTWLMDKALSMEP